MRCPLGGSSPARRLTAHSEALQVPMMGGSPRRYDFTVDRELLLYRLLTDVFIAGTALSWSRCCQAGCTPVVSAAGPQFSPESVTCCVPPGSLLEPLLFCVYVPPVEQAIKPHNLIIFQNGAQPYYSFDSYTYLHFSPYADCTGRWAQYRSTWRVFYSVLTALRAICMLAGARLGTGRLLIF